MRYSNVCIEVVTGEIPTNIVSSKSIEDQLQPLYEKLEIPEGSLEKLTGIRERRFWDSGTTPSQGSIWAGEKALQMSNINRNDVGCLFHCGVSRDYLEPATATVVHHHLGLPEQGVVSDISNAHLGFMNGVLTAANMIELGQAKAALIVSSEYSRDTVESGVEGLLKNPTLERYQTSFPSLTLGDGAVAMLLTHKSISNTGHQLLGGAVRCEISNTLKDNSWTYNSENNSSDGFFQKRVNLVKDVWQSLMHLANWTPELVKKTFHHEIGPKGRLFNLLNLKKSQNFSVTERFGNLLSIGAPMALVNGLEGKALVKGDCFALLGMGFHLNCLMLGGVWNS